jgi:hypothetical protein
VKRQLLRWLIHKKAPLTNDVLEVIRELLSDRDWEVRATAMFAAGRLGAAQLRSVIDRTDIPAGDSHGLDYFDRNMLVAARQVIIAQLNGFLSVDQPEEQFAAIIAKMPGVPLHFARAVVGKPLEFMTRESLFIASLTTPADTQVSPPEPLPPGVVAQGERYFLNDTEIELVWIAPIPHWIGDDPARLAASYPKVELEPNPICLTTPERGFFIARYPLSALTVAPSSPDAPVALPARQSPAVKPDYLLATFEASQRICEGLSQLTGAQVVLPTADQWEMAARGPDGRRYPSGNVVEQDMLLQPSPWDVYHTVGVAPQWARSTRIADTSVICGAHIHCAARSPQGARETAAIRPSVMG